MTDDDKQVEEKNEEAPAVVEETSAKAPEEVKVEAKAEEPKEVKAEAKEENPAEDKAEAKKPSKQLSSKLGKLAKEVEGLTALELSELASHMEEVFGVSAMPMTGYNPAPGATGTSGDAAGDKEEKATYDVTLTDGGANKLAVIKAVREILPDVGLMDAKKLVESAPKELLTGAKKDDAESAKKKIEDAGGKVELK